MFTTYDLVEVLVYNLDVFNISLFRYHFRCNIKGQYWNFIKIYILCQPKKVFSNLKKDNYSFIFSKQKI